MQEDNNKKIITNSIALYVRQLLVLFITLYTSRIVLDVLGVVDFGIYNVVAGLVSMMSFLSAMMNAATTRFFSYGLGKNDIIYVRNVFGLTLIIYALLIIIIVFFAESAGVWFLENKLVIPIERIDAAKSIFHFSVGTLLFTLLSVPFISLITAHESMKAYAYIGIFEVVFKLLVIVFISFADYDKLSLYGFFMMCTTIFVFLLYVIYCKKKYPECVFHIYFEKKMFLEILSYSGWSLFGACVNIARGAATNILLNMFFGPITNAARAISSQISNGVVSFSNSFFNAVRPQIIKSYAGGDIKRMTFLIEQSAKGVFFLMLIMAIPIFFETRFLFNLWLKTYPDEAIIFTRLILIEILLDSISLPIIAAANATGKIKLYQTVVGGIMLSCVPISYFVLKNGGAAISVIIVLIITVILGSIARLYLTKRVLEFSPFSFLKRTIPSIIIVSICSISTSYFIRSNLCFGGARFIIVVVTSFFSISFFAFVFGCSRNMQKMIIQSIYLKFLKKKVI